MPPTLILIRHAQALHNVNQQYDIPDPSLSELGFQQLSDLKKSLQENILAQNAGALITSPMRRTIQTALGSVDWLVDKGLKLEVDADWQENSAKPCDTGSPVSSLITEFPTVDFIDLDPVFPDKTSAAGAPYTYTKAAILGRGQRALKKLYDRPEKVIIVVSHSGFLRMSVSGSWFYNADYRIFDFAERDSSAVDQPYRLVQHESTLQNGGGLGKSFKDLVVIGEGLPDEEPKILC